MIIKRTDIIIRTASVQAHIKIIKSVVSYIMNRNLNWRLFWGRILKDCLIHKDSMCDFNPDDFFIKDDFKIVI